MLARHCRLLLPLIALTLAARTPPPEPADRPTPAATVSETWAAPSAVFARTNCGTCEISFCGHTLTLGGSEDYANPHTNCVALPDCSGHPACSVSYLPELEKRRFTELVDGAVNGSMESVEILLRDFGEVAELNGERESLQIRGCDPGTFMANIPLTPLEFASASQFAAAAAGAGAKN